MLIRTDDQGPVGLGYLQLDNRACPLPGGRAMVEMDTYTCTHCQRVVAMNPERKRERYKCRGCSHHICDGCAAKRAAGGPCRTWAQVVDEHLSEVEKRSEGGILLP